MKVVILIACVIGVAVAETCDGVDTTQCANEVCTPDYVPTCVTGICTCDPLPDPSACQALSDCDSYWSSHHCNKHHRYCTNGHCTCTHHG